MQAKAYSINATASALGIGRSSVYQLIKHQQLAAFKLGRRTLVTAESVSELVNLKTQEGLPKPLGK